MLQALLGAIAQAAEEGQDLGKDVAGLTEVAERVVKDLSLGAVVGGHELVAVVASESVVAVAKMDVGHGDQAMAEGEVEEGCAFG